MKRRLALSFAILSLWWFEFWWEWRSYKRWRDHYATVC